MRSLGIAAIATCTLFFTLHVQAQIPMECAQYYNPQNPGECCPVLEVNGKPMGKCGSGANRGNCVSVGQRCNTAYTESVVNVQNMACGQNLTDERLNWPSKLFSHVCKCEGNYGDYDCGGCAYGYINNSNSECVMEPRRRRSITSLSGEEWEAYLKLLQTAKSTNSTRYVVLTDKQPYYTNISTYDLFIWLHHYSTKDHLDYYGKGDSACDYAHESTGFLTWHRILLLWLERELQILDGNYAFRISYWDWTNEGAREKQFDRLFSYDGLGSSSMANPTVSSKYFGSWKTICLDKCNDKCDPYVTGKPLKRCLSDTYCDSEFPEWPSREDLKEAWNMDSFEDPQTHNKYAKNSFSNFVEGYELQDGSCGKTLCDCDWRGNTRFARKLHNSVHIILGLESFGDKGCSEPADTRVCKSSPEKSEAAAMADVRASPNDPVFIHHHAMIDLIFEEWLKNHSSASYGGPPSNSKFPGHAAGDCAVPFMPVFTHSEAFKTADNFGYSYEPLEDDTTATPATTTGSSVIMVSVPMIITGIVLTLITILA